MVTAAMKLKDACSLEGKHRQHIKEKPRQHIQKQRHYIANKGPSSQSYGFCSSYVWIGEGNGTPLQYSCLENPMDKGPGGLQSMGSLRVGHN